jgi:hypothetical protein
MDHWSSTHVATRTRVGIVALALLAASPQGDPEPVPNIHAPLNSGIVAQRRTRDGP